MIMLVNGQLDICRHQTVIISFTRECERFSYCV